MTATSEFMSVKAAKPAPVRMADGGRMVVRVAQLLFGAALTLAAIGIWLAPGASWESDVMLLKLVLSLTALLAGFGLMHSSSTPSAPEVEIDTIRREVRLVRPAANGSAEILQRCAFNALSRAEQRGGHVRLWDQSGDLLAEVTLTDRDTLKSLVAGLRDTGKLV